MHLYLIILIFAVSIFIIRMFNKIQDQTMPGVLPLPAPLSLSGILINLPIYGVPRAARAAD
jgi:hypothetical protein